MTSSPYYNNTYSDGFFNISPDNGFLPIKDPLVKLPSKYSELQRLIDNLPVNLTNDNNDMNHNKGILGTKNAIVAYVSDLPNYTEIIRNETDVFVLQALFRAYTFVTSGYTLESSYTHFLETGNYGLARDLLPANVAEPLNTVAQKLDVYPWLDYHYAYSLGNYVKKDAESGLHWRNLDMAVKFTGTTDEIGFIMVHVYINEVSPDFLKSIFKLPLATTDFNRNRCLNLCAYTLKNMNMRRKDMWTASRHERYNDFRVFIMGIKGNDTIFPNGLIYDSQFNNEPQRFRGQTGAQDNIIPTADIFTGIVDYYPDNELTKYLYDLRSYRPKCVQNFFSDLRSYYGQNKLFLFEMLKSSQNIEGLVYLLMIVDEVYLFRNGHWQFVQKYIMNNTKYAFATGGTPITSWLINQIEAVLRYEKDIIMYIQNAGIPETINNWNEWVSLSTSYKNKVSLLEQQVEELKKVDYNIDLIYGKNKELHLEDNEITV